MVYTKKTGPMTSEATKEITEKIDSLEEQASQGSFVPHRRQDVLTVVIGRSEHPGRVRAAGADGLAGGVDHRKSYSAGDGILQPNAVPVSVSDAITGIYTASGAKGRLYEGSTVVHNIPLLHGQVKVGVEEVKDAETPVPVPIDKVTLVGQTLNTFLAWPIHLVKRLSEQAVVSLAKPPKSPDREVDDPLHLMTLTIPQLFLKPLKVMWDASLFGLFNSDFPLYIKHEDLYEIAHGGQCLSISVIQL
ncbi:hypothetical protein GmHk_11G032439 [Glycine max]|nr:hypothetical protein GmHk_11G032439 [Glycine max]